MPSLPSPISRTSRFLPRLLGSHAATLIVLVATLAMVPELAAGLIVTDNFRFNLTWPEQFVELFRHGHIYPRWLPNSWGGMGSPVFYFYPPLFFWVTSLIDTVTGGTLSSERLVPLASLLLLIASGLSMRMWLRRHCGDRQATLGAIAYMLAPYHLYHFYGTGALAEASTYASVPIVMLALAQLGEGKSRYITVLALAYATLLFSHLPTALLVTLFLIAPYTGLVCTRTARPFRFMVQALTGGLIGIGISAVFVVPALALLPEVSPAALSGPFYRPENWFFWHIRGGIMSARMLLIVPISVAGFLFAAASAFNAKPKPTHRAVWFWPALTTFLVMLIAGLIPFVWKLPGLMLVQFPWRALSLVEFTAVTALAMRPPARSSLILGAAASLAFAYLVLGLIAVHMVGRTWTGQSRTAAEIRADYGGAPEYLPAGTRIDLGTGPDDVRIALPRLPLASAGRSRAYIKAFGMSDGGMVVEITTPVATKLRLRRFYFPHWQIRDGWGHSVPVAPDLHDRVVSFQVPAGHSTFQLVPGTAPYEATGRDVSFIALIILVIVSIAMIPVTSEVRELLTTGKKGRPLVTLN